MENQKSFFELLSPRTSVLVGVLSGIGVLCAAACLIFVILAAQGKIVYVNNPVKKEAVKTDQTQNVQNSDVVKTDKPAVELFVMSYCPYGLQMQKALLPVMELFGKKADISIKFVSYIMHDKKEIDENNLQYCLENEQEDKFIPYLKCFTVSGDSASCLKEVKVNESKLSSCIAVTDKKFGTTAAYNDKASWLSGYYPLYNVHKDLNEKYGVQGSPTLVINGSQVQVARSPEAVKQAICASFEEQPEECGQTLSTASAAPSFGAGTGTGTTAECGS
ncbi:MAG TPA: thioredoxin domain-containing protein [Candidatus Magasanikbacteria bacterium]|nr:thioredoxin domain-containing protein [Candidatus Magasanikbacteria bacterium]